MVSLLPGLRRAAPRLSRDFFICQQCLKKPLSTLRNMKVPSKSPLLRIVRFNSSATTLSENVAGNSKSSSPLSSLSQSISKSAKAEAEKQSKNQGSKFFPETSSNTVAYWLLGSAASVFGIVIFGGLTRLTESGYLSLLNRSC